MPYTEYQIISELNIYEFTKKINQLMKEMWQPSGNVNLLLAHISNDLKVVESGDLVIIYSQAMVR
jgi:thiamine phosphate synthase YjbQ (UPF0047 family)